ncbi:MAG: porin family protein [Reichenbachiella sp.]
MKKILILAIALFATSAMYGQEGSMYVGGALGFGDYYENSTGNTWKVAPEVGYWMKDNIQLGIVATFYGNEIAGDKYTTIAPHVYGRLWFPVGDKFSLYAGANFRFVNTSNDNDAIDSDSYVDIFVDAGFAYSVADKWGLVGRVASLGLFDGDFGLDANLSPSSLFNVGIYYTFKQ